MYARCSGAHRLFCDAPRRLQDDPEMAFDGCYSTHAVGQDPAAHAERETHAMKDVLILGGARTPMTEYVGALKDVSAIELGAIASRGAFQKTGVKPEWVDHVVFGNVLQTSADAIYGARHVALKACVPIEVPALTVNRLCGSGIQAAVTGAQMIQLGEADIVLTGGIESMSQAPHVMRGLRTGLRLGQGKLEDSLYEALLDPYCGLFMA